MPVRIQLSRTKGWRMPPNTVKVDRGTRWGNPFVVTRPCAGQWDVMRRFPGPWFFETALSEADAIAIAIREYRQIAARLPTTDLRGKNVACWCALDQPCHADVLLELANAPARADG